MWNKQSSLCKTCLNPFLEPTSTKQLLYSFLLQDPTGAFDGTQTYFVRNDGWNYVVSGLFNICLNLYLEPTSTNHEAKIVTCSRRQGVPLMGLKLIYTHWWLNILFQLIFIWSGRVYVLRRQINCPIYA